MAAMIQTDAFVAEKVAAILAALSAAGLRIHLFKNNIVPANTDVLGAYTEANFDGYAAQALGTWGSSGPIAHVYTLAPPAVVFANITGVTPNNIYGYYITDSADSVLLMAVRDPGAPESISLPGTTYTCTVLVTDQAV